MSLLWVAGGRDYSHVPAMRSVLKTYADDGRSLITGSQRGADLTAETLWRNWEAPYQGVPAKWGMREHVELLKQQGLPVPAKNPDPRITIQNTKKQAVET